MDPTDTTDTTTPKPPRPRTSRQPRPPRKASKKTPDSDDAALREALASRFRSIYRTRGLNQVQAAALVGTGQSVISQILRGDLKDLSLGRLLRFLALIGQDVRIEFGRYHKDGAGQVSGPPVAE